MAVPFHPDPMPATLLSHQALVLPLKLRWPARFSGLALCIGSAAPDLEFIGRMADDWLVSHTFAAQLYFTVPVTLALVWLLTTIVFPVLLPFVTDHPRLRLRDLAALVPPGGGREWAMVAASAWIGGCSHLLLDGITHGQHSGWAVDYLPVLRTPVPHPGGPVPLHDAFQLWLTLLLGLAGGAMWLHIARHRLLWRWRGQQPRDIADRRWIDGARLTAGLAFAGANGATVGLAIHAPTSTKATAAAVAFGAIDFACLALLVVAIALRHRLLERLEALRMR